MARNYVYLIAYLKHSPVRLNQIGVEVTDMFPKETPCAQTNCCEDAVLPEAHQGEAAFLLF